MEKIQHKNIQVNGINMHVAEIGEGPAVLFVHGFPELWYTWRHQMLSLSSRGYRAIAPDLCGYGDTEAPPSPTSYTVFHLVGDLVALLDALGLDKVFVVGHDWGAIVCWNLCLFRPDRVKALVNTSVVFTPRNPAKKPLEIYKEMFGDEFYICRFQEAKMDEEFAEADTKKLITFFFSIRDPKPPCLPKGKTISQFLELVPSTRPSWMTEEDLDYYASKFSTKGFAGGSGGARNIEMQPCVHDYMSKFDVTKQTQLDGHLTMSVLKTQVGADAHTWPKVAPPLAGGLNYYRCFDLNWELSAPWTGAKIQVPVKFVVGDLDLTYHITGVKEFIHDGGLKKFVPNLEEVVVLEGVAHFLNEEKPEVLNDHIYDFIQKF